MTTTECFGCGKSVSGGLQIFEQYLCPDCELKIIQTRVAKPDYQYWVDRCRQFWEKTGVFDQDSED